MSDNTESRKFALENALCETDKLMDMFVDVLRGREVQTYPKHDFSDTALKIMGIKTDKSVREPEEKAESDVGKTTDERADMNMQQLLEYCRNCTGCRLCSTRKNTVFGEGCADSPDVMVIGEGPGETEDITGRPFVGKAGQYLDTWLRPISVSRDKNAYITNIVKCRPPQNRDPQDDEKEMCFGFLKQQISLINPRAILCLGRPASSMMTGEYDASMGSLRGRFFFYESRYPMICTYHPAAVLRDPALKKPVWEDLQKLARFLNLEIVRK